MAKSALQQVIDELSLDFANGKYLNVISSNYGLNRPLFGFSDDLWRAITKVVALQYKQISNKFADIIELVLGPKISQCSGLAENTQPGDLTLKVHDASGFPQVGTIVLDKDTVLEETIAYRFIDYSSNTIFLTSSIQYSHAAVSQDTEMLVLLGDAGTNTIILENVEQFSDPASPYIILLGRGTGVEEIKIVVGKSTLNRTLTTFSSLSNTFKAEELNLEKTSLSTAYVKDSFYLTVGDSSSFPDNGVLLLGRCVNTFTAVSGSSNTVTVAASTFSSLDSLSGYKIHFDGNITAALANFETFIAGNTLNSISFISSLPATPSAGDTFYIRPVIQFTGKSENILNLKYIIQSDLNFASGTTVESYKYFPTAKVSTVLVQGVNWDIFQATPNLVEIVIPFDDSQLQSPKSASYPHTNTLGVSTTTSGVTSIGDLTLAVTNGASFPDTGLVIIDDGGPNQEIVGYSKFTDNTWDIPYVLDVAHAAGESVDYYDFAYIGSGVLFGDWNIFDYVYPGPNLYDPDVYGPVFNTPTTITQNLAPPTSLAIDVLSGVGPKAVEVVDANLFPLSGSFSARLGSETLTVTAVSLKSRAQAILNGLHNPSATTLNVDAGTLAPAVTGAAFPNANGYRVKIGRGTANVEICYVTAIDTGANTITISPGLQQSHADNSIIELMSDTLTVSQIDEDHIGIVAYAERAPVSSTLVPEAEISVFNYNDAEILSVLYSTLTVSNATGYSTDGGTVLLNYGVTKEIIKDNLLSAVVQTDTTLPLVSSNKFPTSYPFYVIVDPGTRFEEVLEITNNNTGTDVLTVFNSGGYGTLRYGHVEGTEIRYVGKYYEELNYSSRSGNTLTFSPPVMVQYPHSVNSSIIFGQLNTVPINGNGYPLRVPVDYRERLQSLLDLVRAAGVQVRTVYRI